MHAQEPRGLGDVAAIRVHRRHDVLSFERLDRLLERNSISNQFTNDLRQTIVDAHMISSGFDFGKGDILLRNEKNLREFQPLLFRSR